MNFQNLSIRVRLTLGFGLLIGLLMGVSYIGFSELVQVSRNTEIIVQDRLVKLKRAQTIENEINRQARALRTALITRDAQVIEAELAKIEKSAGVIQSNVASLQATIYTDEGKQALQRMQAARQAFKAEEATLMSMIRDHQIEQARAELVGRLLPLQNEYLQSVEALTEVQSKAINQYAADAADAAAGAERWIVILSVLALVLAVLVSAALLRSILGPMAQLRAGMKAVEQTSDFSRRIPVTGKDEVGETCRAFNDLLQVQQVALQQVSQAVSAMAEGDFASTVTAELRGDLQTVKVAINQSVASMKATMAAMNAAMQALSEGQFKVQLDAQVHGEFKLTLDLAQDALNRLQAMMSDVGRVMADVAKGQLRVRVQAEGRGELAELKRNINESLLTLAETLAQMREGTHLIAAQSNQANAAVSQIAFGAQTQTHSVEQVSAALRSSASAISDIAHSTEQASQQSRESVLHVRTGKDKIAEMIDVVGRIAQNSQKINKISEVIESIAYRTNLLSLNAAIEAARAGEQGKGFAVVADEVGKLAISSASSTKEIAELVKQAATEAHIAVDTVAVVQKEMDAIEVGAVHTDTLLRRVAVAAEEQNAAMHEIDANMGSLSQVASSNAHASDELNATSQELSRVAANNERALARFSF